MSTNDSAQVSLKLRNRDKKLYALLSAAGLKNGEIFRLGLIEATKRYKELNPETTERLWEQIAAASILGK